MPDLKSRVGRITELITAPFKEVRSCGNFALLVVSLHMKAKHSASSSDEIAVFQAYTNPINSEPAPLLANSLIIGALAISPTAMLGQP